MELAFLLLLLGATGVIVLGFVGVGATAVAAAVPFQRWTFAYQGRAIEIRASLVGEEIRVDGVRVRTRRDEAGDRAVRHDLRLDNGRVLRLWIRTGLNPSCVVDDGQKVVFTASGSGSGTPDERPLDDDPRLLAAQVLLADLAAVDPRAAGDLEVALERMLAAERSASTQAAAHAVLGGDAEELVLRRQLEVDQLLMGIRELHLGVMGRDHEAATAAHRALARLGALHEIERL